MRAGPPIQWSHWKMWGDDGEMFSQSFRLNKSSLVGQWISQWEIQEPRDGPEKQSWHPRSVSSHFFQKNIAGNNPGSSVFTAPVGIHPSLGHTSLQQSQTVTHTHIHTHTRHKFTLKESILINAGLALNTGGRPSWTTELTLHLRGVHVHKRDRDG